MTKKKTPPSKFSAIIEQRGLKRTWVAEQIHVCPGHLTNILKGKDVLTDKRRKMLNELLKTDF